MPTNDNETGGGLPPSADAHGYAALLLVESLIHGLCENETLSADEAVDIADRAVEVQGEQAEAADGRGARMWESQELLKAIAASLRTDGSKTPPPPLRPVT